MKAFAFLNGSKRTQQQPQPRNQQSLPQLLVSRSSREHDDPPLSAPASSPHSSTRSNASSLRARPALSLRLPRRSNDSIFSANATLLPDTKPRSPIYTRFGFSKSSSQLPSPPVLNVPKAGGSNPPTPTSTTPPVPVIPSHLASHSSPRSVKPQDLPDEGSPARSGIPRAEQAFKQTSAVQSSKATIVDATGNCATSLDTINKPATSILLQRRRARSMGSSMNREDTSTLKIPPPLQLAPPMPLAVRLDSATSIQMQNDRVATSSLLTPTSLGSSSPMSTTVSLSHSPQTTTTSPTPLSPGPATSSPRAGSGMLRLRSESNSTRSRSESNSSRARSESNSSATSYRLGNYSSNLQACNESPTTAFSSRPNSIKVRPRNGSGLSSGSGTGIGLRLDDVCDSFLKEVKQDLKQDMGPLFMNDKRKKPRSSEPAVKGRPTPLTPAIEGRQFPPLPPVPASAPATVVSFRHNPSTAEIPSPKQEFRILSKTWSVVESESSGSQILSTAQSTPTKNRPSGAESLPRMQVTAPQEEPEHEQHTTFHEGYISKTQSMDSISSLPYLRFSVAHREGIKALDEANFSPVDQIVAQTSSWASCLDLSLPPALVRTNSEGEVPLNTPPDERPISAFSIDSITSRFSDFSLSLFPSPPSVPTIRPTTEDGTFATASEDWEDDTSTPRKGEAYNRVLQFKSIVPSRKTNLHNIILLNSIKGSRESSRATTPNPVMARGSSPVKSKSASPGPDDTPLAAPNYVALLKGMEGQEHTPTSRPMYYTTSAGSPRKISSSSKLRSLFNSSVGSMSSHGKESVESPESTKSNSDNSKFQWGYAL